jgi:hypothetical protein
MMGVKKIPADKLAHLETLQATADGVWTAEQDYATPFLGNVGIRSTVVRLRNNELFIHSPIQLTENIRRDLIKLGTPRFLIGTQSTVAPYFAQYQDAFPTIKLFGSPGLLRKHHDIRFYGTLRDGPEVPAWSLEIDQHVISGKKSYEETIFFHRASGTLIVADLFCALPASDNWLQTQARQFFAGKSAISISRKIRQALRGNANIKQSTLAWLADCQPRQIVMGHGAIFDGDPDVACALLSGLK